MSPPFSSSRFPAGMVGESFSVISALQWGGLFRRHFACRDDSRRISAGSGHGAVALPSCLGVAAAHEAEELHISAAGDRG